MSQNQKREAALAALAEVRAGMRLGLGTGSTAREFVSLLGRLVAEGLDVVCVPTSVATERQARELGIRLTDLESTPELDLTIDGADEIGPELVLIKGAGGALLREKIVAAASSRFVVIADASKQVAQLGRCPLPIEVNAFGLGVTKAAVHRILRDGGADGPLQLRMGEGGQPFVTDGGHLILDAFFGRISAPEALSQALLDIPGVVQHGLFLGLCSRAYVGGPAGVTVIDA